MFGSSVESQYWTQSQVCMNKYAGMNGWMMYEYGHEQAEVRHTENGLGEGRHLTSRRAFWAAQYQARLTREASF